MSAHDDLGNLVALPRAVRRIVSLVPSLTEAVASIDPSVLTGVTRFCTHPAGLPAERIGGTKNPDVPRIANLEPDLVLANEEENRAPDLDELRTAGVSVWVTRVRSLPEALDSLGRMLSVACGLPGPGWLEATREAWQEAQAASRRRLAIIPVWRRPWMVLGSDTFAGDLLARLGVANVYAAHAERYPKIGLTELRQSGADLVVLPDEPYQFAADDGPEAFAPMPAALVSGRHLTWYGPSLAHAPAVLGRQLGSAR